MIDMSWHPWYSYKVSDGGGSTPIQLNHLRDSIMATRSYIAIKHSDNTYTGVYSHYDGYVEHNGKILQEDYQNRDDVIKLIDGGDMSLLKTTHTWQSEYQGKDAEGVSIYDKTREEQPLYYDERGDVDIEPKHFNTYQEMFDYAGDCGCEYLYVYDDQEQGQPVWSHASCSSY